MSLRIAINGFGRIGRAVCRIVSERDDIDLVAVNDLFDTETLAHLLKYDTAQGTFAKDVKVEGPTMFVDGKPLKMLAERDPSKLPWGDLDIDVVVEATGIFRTSDSLKPHMAAGAKRLVLTVPPKDQLDAMVVIGVNDEILKASDRMVSNASCTTNCLAPMAKVLDDAFGLETGIITTTHAYTNDQRLIDAPHKDLRRARAAAENIIPTTTGAARAVGKILPKLAGRLDGGAVRVPVPDGSVVDLVARLGKPVTVEQVNAAAKEAAEGPLKGVLEYNTSPIVSCDIVGDPHSCIFDAPFTRVLGGNYVRVFGWYDNEWGYSNRVVDLLGMLNAFGPPA